MRWGAMLVVLFTWGASSALADEASPYFGSDGQSPFQIVVDGKSGQPVAQQVPVPGAVAVVK